MLVSLELIALLERKKKKNDLMTWVTLFSMFLYPVPFLNDNWYPLYCDMTPESR
jgi:hypothetical protein